MAFSTKLPYFKLTDLKNMLTENKDLEIGLNTEEELEPLTVITGKNGIGKSQFLKAIKQYIVTNLSSNFPKLIVRRLNYGEEYDNYDPDVSDHPLVTEHIIGKLFDCNYETFQNLVKEKTAAKTKMTENKSELDVELKVIFDIYYQNILKRDLKNLNEMFYFIEFKKYFRRQILKKICYGSLQQLLILNVRYDFDLNEINNKIDEVNQDGLLKFDYKIEKNFNGIVEKLDLNESILFVKGKIKIQFKSLSPGEKLILHLILILKDKENIRIKDPLNDVNQILLLDEPDSHCEPNLAKIFVEIIEQHVVNDLGIQVIMTTHNSTTVFSVPKEFIYVLEYDDKDKKVKCSKGPDKKTVSFILDSNITYLIDLQKHFTQLFYTYKFYVEDIHSEHGHFFEKIIKYLTNNKTKNSPFPEYQDVINNLIGGILNPEELNTKTVKFAETYNLEDYSFSDDEDVSVIWATNNKNLAWEFMIYLKSDNQLYLYNCKTGKKDQSDTLKKHLKVLDRLKERIEILKGYFQNVKPDDSSEFSEMRSNIRDLENRYLLWKNSKKFFVNEHPNFRTLENVPKDYREIYIMEAIN